MSDIIFTDKNSTPSEKDLTTVLGKSWSLWNDFRNDLEERYGPLNEEWKFYMKKSGWTLKVLRKKRNLFFFSPRQNYFNINFVFGDKAVKAAEESDLPLQLKQELRNARKYMEGRGLPVKVETAEQLVSIKKLVQIKIEN